VPRDQLEAAVPAGADPRRYARVLEQVYDATLAGTTPPARPRELIADSWRRVRRHGLDPDRGSGPAPLGLAEVEHRRRESPLGEVLPGLRDGLVSVADDAGHIMVVVDAEGRVLWRDGSSAVRRQADGLGFVEGACWDEDAVGTNAIGTALAVGHPVQVYSAEHYVRTHHAWTCAAAPVRDPRDGALLGVIDVSGPAATVHPSTLALVDAVARLAELQLRSAHHLDLERLRVVASPMLARLGGPALVVDRHGWVAAASGLAPLNRVLLPQQAAGGPAWLPALGRCLLEPLPGGWLVRTAPAEQAPAARVELDLRAPARWTLSVRGSGGSWQHPLSLRHAEILLLLATHPDGRSATELAGDLFGDPARTITVRAELSRLRRHLGGVLDHRPYRFGAGVQVVLQAPAQPADLLPCSTAPAVRAMRACG
jgi:hypothetical protein